MRNVLSRIAAWLRSGRDQEEYLRYMQIEYKKHPLMMEMVDREKRSLEWFRR